VLQQGLDNSRRYVHNEPMSKLVLIRARLTDSEWKRIRTLAIKRDTTTADLVADTLRDALLKGAKP